MNRRGSSKIFLGWWINLVTAINTGLGLVFTLQGASALLKPIAADLGLTRTAASVATGIGTLLNGVMFSLSGWLSDKFGPKWVIIVGSCICGTGMVLLRFVSAPWAYYVVWGLIIAPGASLGFTVANDVMLTNWFIRRRGLAFSVRFGTMGLLGAIALPIVSWLIATQGWRTTSLIWAGVVFAGVPFAMYFVKQKPPEHYGLLPDGARTESSSGAGTDAMIAKGAEYAAGLHETDFTIAQIVRTPTYWILIIVWVLHGIVMGGFNIHIIPFLTDMNIDLVAAGSLVAMMSLFTVPARFFGGLVADRVKKDHLKFLVAGTLLLWALGITAFLVSQNMAGVYIFLIMYGFGSGVFTPLDIVVRSRYFGRRAYGRQQGISALISAPIQFLAPIYTGWIYDTTGKYTAAFTLYAVLAAVSAFLMLLARPPRLPVQIKAVTAGLAKSA